LFFSISFAQNTLLDTMFGKAKRSLGRNDYPEAIILYQQCLKEAQKQKDWFHTGNAFIGIGIANDRSSNYENALRNYFDALHAYEQASDNKKQAGTLKNIGNAYRVIKTYDKADAYFQQALQKFKSLKDSTGISNVLNDIGIMNMDEQRNEEALSYFKEVINNYDKNAVPQVMAYAYNNAAIIFSRLRNYSNAYTYYNLSLKLMKRIHEDYGVALTLINLGDLFNQQGNYEEALNQCKEGLAIAQKINSKQLVASAYQTMAESYKRTSDFKQSNIYLDKLLAINDTIFKDESAKSYAEMETRYQNEKKQKEIVLLKQQNTIKSIELESNQRTKYFLLIILALVILTTVLLIRSYSIKQKLNAQLTVTNEKLDEANHSKTKLLSILTHDLRSPISSLFNFLQLQKRTFSKLSPAEQEKYSAKINTAAENVLDAMEDVLIWSKSQMEKFTAVHEKVHLNELCEEIINLNSTGANNKNIQLLKLCPENLTLQTDPNFLKIVLRNLIANAVKFTPAGGKIELTAGKQTDAVVLTISDNGDGIAPDHLLTIFDWNSIRSDSTGLGLKLAKEFTEKLNGSITVHSQPSKGTTFILSFPHNAF
jgi:signal transduction histidine kinase